MLRCGQAGADAVEALEKANRDFLESLAEIVGPDWPNPFDERYDLELLLENASEWEERNGR